MKVNFVLIDKIVVVVVQVLKTIKLIRFSLELQNPAISLIQPHKTLNLSH